VDKVSRMTRFDHESRTRIPIPLCLVSIHRDENYESIHQVQHILRAAVTIEKYSAPNRKFQCFNCLDFGHGTEACHRPTVCSHCSGSHKYSDCDKEHLGRECKNCLRSNCGGKHQANSILCPMRSKPRTTTSSSLLPRYRERPQRKRRQAQYEDRGSGDWSTPEEAADNEAATQGSLVTPSSENQQHKTKRYRNHKTSHNTQSAPQQRREKPYYNEQSDPCIETGSQPETFDNNTTASRRGSRHPPNMTYTRAAASTSRNEEERPSPQEELDGFTFMLHYNLSLM
jgi:hypothetical protein